MSDEQSNPFEENNDNNDDQGFFGMKSEESQDKERQKQIDNIPLISDAFKPKKSKHIKKREKGHKSKLKVNKQEEKQKKKLEEAQKQADQIIVEMGNRYDEDRKRYQQKRPSNKKLLYLPILDKKLKNGYVWEKFLQLGGLVQFQLWFSKLPQGLEPSLTLRKGLLQILDSQRIKSEHITRVSEIQRIVQKHKKSQTKQLRQISESILLKWSKTLHEQDL